MVNWTLELKGKWAPGRIAPKVEEAIAGIAAGRDAVMETASESWKGAER